MLVTLTEIPSSITGDNAHPWIDASDLPGTVVVGLERTAQPPRWAAIDFPQVLASTNIPLENLDPSLRIKATPAQYTGNGENAYLQTSLTDLWRR